MRSFLLIVFGWPLLLLLLLSGVQLAQRQGLLPTPSGAVSLRRFVPRDGHTQAAAAVRRLQALSAAKRVALLAGLRRHVIPLDRWLARLAQAPPGVLCLGEDHLDATRRFVADWLVSGLRFDGLLLEATPRELHTINVRIAAGETRAELLGADIARLLRAVHAANPEARVAGIEETDQQRGKRQRQAWGSLRDSSLARNFWSQYEFGKRYVVLYGALHCAPRHGWLYTRLLQQVSPPTGGLVAVRVIGERYNDSTDAFVRFLSLSGLGDGRQALVIERADTLGQRIQRWFPILRASWEAYSTVIIYRDADPSPLRNNGSLRRAPQLLPVTG